MRFLAVWVVIEGLIEGFTEFPGVIIFIFRIVNVLLFAHFGNISGSNAGPLHVLVELVGEHLLEILN